MWGGARRSVGYCKVPSCLRRRWSRRGLCSEFLGQFTRYSPRPGWGGVGSKGIPAADLPPKVGMFPFILHHLLSAYYVPAEVLEMNQIYSLSNWVSVGGRKSFRCTENVTFEQNLEEQVGRRLSPFSPKMVRHQCSKDPLIHLALILSRSKTWGGVYGGVLFGVNYAHIEIVFSTYLTQVRCRHYNFNSNISQANSM